MRLVTSSAKKYEGLTRAFTVFAVARVDWFAAGALVPGAAQEIAAVLKVMTVRGENFEGDSAIVACGLEPADVMGEVDCACA